MTPQLRGYQMDVLDRSRGHLRAGRRRGVIQGETGSGKTYVIAELCRAAQAKHSTTLVLADRRRLIKQIGDTLDRFGVSYGIVMAGATGNVGRSVVVASRDTLWAWQRNGLGTPIVPSVVLIDECHKSMGQTYQSILELFPRSAVVGFTATPARTDGKSLGSFFEWIECTVPASQLIAEGWLLKPEVYSPIELATGRKSGSARPGMLAGDPVEHWKKHATDLRTIAFSRTVEDSLALRDRFRHAGITAEHIDASADDAEREEAFERLRKKDIFVLCSVQLLIEGVDIPEVECALLWSKFGSPIQYRQACGRIMRPAKGKTRAVVLDHSGAAGEHGLPGDDVEWSLDEGSSVQTRRKKSLKDGRSVAPVVCRECGYVFTPSGKSKPVCPSCGWVAPVRKSSSGQSAKTQASILSRIDGAWNPFDPKLLEKERFVRAWRRCAAIAKAKGAKASMAAAMFKRDTGRPPWECGIDGLPERGDWQRPAIDVL